MTTYISLLRGINVGGQKMIKMDALQKLYELMGFQGVTTYLQSGNVVFKANNFSIQALEQKISEEIQKSFSFVVPIIVLSIDKLQQIISNNPFANDANKDVSFLHVTFLASQPIGIDYKMIEDKKQNGEEICLTHIAVYLYCPNGYGRTKLTNNLLENKLKVGATTRNWKTVNELQKSVVF